MAKYLYLLEDVYVIMHGLRNNTKIDNSKGNLGSHCDICFKKNGNHYLLDGTDVELIPASNGKYLDINGENVALIPISISNDRVYNSDLPYIGGNVIKVNSEVINGKVYVSSDALFIIKSDYNLRLEKGIKDDIKYFKEQVKGLRKQKKTNKGRR